MKKYNVKLYYHTTADIEVFANSKDEAIQKAYEVDCDKQLLNNLDEQAVPDVEEIGNSIDKDLAEVIERQATKIANMLIENDEEMNFYNSVPVIANGNFVMIESISYHKAYEDQKTWRPSILLWADENTSYLPSEISSDLTPILDELKDTLEKDDNDE